MKNSHNLLTLYNLLLSLKKNLNPMKRYGLILLLFAVAISVSAQSKKIDTTAVFILERMSRVITELQSCRLNVQATYDIYIPDLGLVKNSEDADIIMKGPDKIFMKLEGDKGERTFFYNGETLSYYSFTNNLYAQIQAPKTILTLADTIYTTFGIDLYAIDFFYPDFIDDLVKSSSILSYLGQTTLNGKNCFHLAGCLPDYNYQIWIQHDSFFLPAKVVMAYTNRKMKPQFEATYNWVINQTYPDAVFEFAVPPGATKTNILPVKK